MAETSAVVGGPQRGLGVGMADEVGILARRRPRGLGGIGGARSGGHGSNPETLVHRLANQPANRGYVLARVDERASFRLARGDIQETGAQAFVTAALRRLES